MKVGIGHCNEPKAFLAGKKAAEKAMEKGNITSSDIAFAFSSGRLDQNDFFSGVQSAVGPDTPIIGGSAIGIITNETISYKGFPAVVAIIKSDRIKYDIASVNGLDKGEESAGRNLGRNLARHLEGTALLFFYDSLKTLSAEDHPPVLNASSPLIKGIEKGLKSKLPIFGAGLIGDYEFSKPARQFCGTYVSSQSAVGVLLTGDFTPYFRIMHGCTPLDGLYHKITKMEGSVIYELDNKPIVDMIDELYGNQHWHHSRPVDLLTIGVNHGERFGEPQESNYVNRLIIGIPPDGRGIEIFEPDLETGTEIQFMLRDSSRMIESAKRNSSEIMDQIKADGKTPILGIYVDCAGRTAEYSNTRTEEAAEVQRVLNQHSTPFFGFYSGVEIAPFLQKSRGLDWTGVLLVLTE